METRPKVPSVFASSGGKYQLYKQSFSCFKMEEVNIEDVKLTPDDIPGASFKDSEICKLTVNQLKFWLKCRRVNQGGNKKVLYERYMLNFKVKFILT